jgi:hypothetical protein
MFNIEIDEKSVFTYCAEELSIGVWDHQIGHLEGPIIGNVGRIKFNSRWQIEHFKEMIELLLEKLDKE